MGLECVEYEILGIRRMRIRIVCSGKEREREGRSTAVRSDTVSEDS